MNAKSVLPQGKDTIWPQHQPNNKALDWYTEPTHSWRIIALPSTLQTITQNSLSSTMKNRLNKQFERHFLAMSKVLLSPWLDWITLLEELLWFTHLQTTALNQLVDLVLALLSVLLVLPTLLLLLWLALFLESALLRTTLCAMPLLHHHLVQQQPVLLHRFKLVLPLL